MNLLPDTTVLSTLIAVARRLGTGAKKLARRLDDLILDRIRRDGIVGDSPTRCEEAPIDP